MPLAIHTDAEKRVVKPDAAEKLTATAARAGITLNTRCGGQGHCQGCRCYLMAGRFRVGTQELEPAREGPPALVRACQTSLLSTHGEICFPHSSVVEYRAQIDDVLDLPAAGQLNWRPVGEPAAPYGVAVDIGTTTVVAVLVDLRDGTVLDKASMYNQQIGRADDVASRISYATTPEKLAELQTLVLDKTINRLIQILCSRHKIKRHAVGRLVVSGNTVMTHLFYGLSPETIGRIPFNPVTRSYADQPAAALGVDIHPAATVSALPSVSGYIGGDLVADMYVIGLPQRATTTLLVDIGTNGEMILQHNGQLTACATAAGPAFEGAGLSSGCRAAEGAIEAVTNRPDGLLEWKVIGHTAPKGICGSGVVDFLAAGLRAGWLNARGRFDVAQLRALKRYHAAGQPDQPVHSFLLAPAEESLTGEPVYVSEYDVAQVLKAKGAIFAGLVTLLERVGLTFQDLDRIELAGGFAKHLNLTNAVHIGLLPDIPLDRFKVVGNGSLAGAYRGLMEEGALAQCDGLIDRPQIVELNLEPSFEANFIDALSLPHLDLDWFPGFAQRNGHSEPLEQI